MQLKLYIILFKYNTVSFDNFGTIFEVLTAVKMSVFIFWVVTPCGPVGRYQSFGETYCPHLQGRAEAAPKMEAVRFSETLVSSFKSIRRYNLYD
jgi:hypothetical protein